MNPEIKSLWLAALRSGEYQQGRERLYHHGKRCCLGVLCELAFQARVTTFDPVLERYGNEPHGLPKEVRTWAGLTVRYPVVNGMDITVLNDGDKHGSIDPRDFTEIADIIERYL